MRLNQKYEVGGGQIKRKEQIYIRTAKGKGEEKTREKREKEAVKRR